MHFKCDENIPIQLVSLLKSKGYSASSVFSENISGIDDKRLIDICMEEKYTLITLDSDFANPYAYPPMIYDGIIVLRLKSQGAKSVMRAFDSLMKSFDLKKFKGKLVIVEHENVRIRE